MPDFQNGQSNYWSGPFMDAINIIAFLIGLENLKLNITSEDLQKHTDQILSEIHGHLQKQDNRLYRVEKILTEMSKGQKGENNNG